MDIYSYVQPQDLKSVNKVIMMQFKLTQGSVATVCKWSGQMNNFLYCKSPQYTVCQILQKSLSVCKNYSEIKKVSIFRNTVYYLKLK